MNENPIGIFDSGIGGLTIYRKIHQLLPYENIIYLADSKNAPYGDKSKKNIIDLSEKNTQFLLKRNCKIIVVACNTASTNAVKILRKRHKVPIIRTQPGIKPAALNSKTKSVGILATQGTLNSDLLYETSQRFAKGVDVTHQIGEGLVKLIESNKIYSEEMTGLLKKYIQPMLNKNIDHLVLGCTHYPFLIPQIKVITGEKVTIIDTGEAIARQTRNILLQESLLNSSKSNPKRYFYTNKDKEVLQQVLNRIDSDLIAEKLDF